ncbi:CPBP family intramembrane glutamic endopeptidase [Anaerococcus hydrogenalis]|uniref:CPBP family intramembrane glutamic endopeptidase n=1 Tax=Anaerococcus hydrogenalis TaxID=33029 RepID=UPI00290341FA|nr:CPBP family intramembrane glutamic endopeptidase [Anaerococcus hydrogenalis]MDU1315896.1 CPBP family intramembrane glutamic endopeptidase [Anaerococcus hydrogenalis]
MYRLYQKNELNFAIFWIVIYCLITSSIRGNFGDESFFMLIGLIFIAFSITFFINNHKLKEKYGLDKYPENSKRYLYFIPVWILVTGNLWGGLNLAYSGISQVWSTISMLLIGYIEEIIFRGFLFKSILEKDGAKKSIIIVAVTFGIGHIVNLFAGQASLETLAQVFFAIAWGSIMVVIFYKSKSLIPCIIAHGLIDAFSKFGVEDSFSQWICIGATIIIAFFYCKYLLKLEDI